MNKYSLSSVALATLWACAMPAKAADPLSLKLSESVSYDNNYARNDTGQTEVVSSTSITLGLNKLYGRQSYAATGKFDVNKHKNFKEQDNNSYSVDGRFATEIASNWALSLNGGSSQYLNSAENNPIDKRLVKNEVTQHNAGMNLQYGVAGRWSLLGSLGMASTSYSLTSFNYQDRDQSSGGLRLVYNTSDLLSFGLGVSTANSEYPHQVIAGVNEEVNQRSVDFSTNWQVTGFSSLSSILSYAKNEYKSDPNASYKGFTGRLNWGFRPGGATSYVLGLSRSTNNDGSGTGLRNNISDYRDFETLQVVSGRSINTQLRTVTNSLDGQIRWAPTAKLAFNATVGWDEYESSRVTTVLTNRNGKSNSRYTVFTLSTDYQFSRAIGFGCNVQQYNQTGESNPQASYGVPRIAYDGRQLGCNASFTID